MIRTRFLIFILLVTPLPLLSQSPESTGILTGTVVEQGTESAIPGATIRLTGTPIGGVSNADGIFRIENIPSGSYSVEVSSIGYAPTRLSDIIISPARPQQIRVEMIEKTDSGDVITVRADLFRRNTISATSTQVLRNEEIRRLPGGFEDVVRAISTLPGVAQVSNGRNDLLVRGGAPSENLYLIDGVESPNINHFGTQGAGGGPLSFVNLDFVDETTFSTGGFGVKYGDKLSSLLTLNLREGRDDQQGGKATISASQFGLNLEGPITEKSSYLFSARRSYLDLIFRLSGFSFVPEYWDFFGKADYRLGPNDNLSGLAIVAIDRIRFFNNDADDRLDNARILDNSQDQLVAGLTWRHLFSNGYLNTTFGRTRIDYRFGQADTLEQSIFSNSSTEDEFNLRMDAFFRLGEGSSATELSFGGNGKLTDFSSDLFLATTSPELDLDIAKTFLKSGVYGQISHELFADIIATLGGRLDYFDGIEEKIYPSARASITLPVTDRTRVTMNAGRYYQAPSYIWLAANEENRRLKEIRADVGVLGIEQIVRDDFKVSVEGYVKNYSNYPASIARPYLLLANTGAGFGGADEGFASFGLEPLSSEGTGRAYGVELFAQKKLSESKWYGTAALSLNSSRFTARDGLERPGNFDQPVIFSLSGGWQISDLWEVGTKFRFASGRPYTPIDSTGDPTFGYQVTDQYNALRLDPSHQLDLRIDRRWPLRNVNLITYIDVQNVYNSPSPTPPRWNPRTRQPEISDGIGILPSIGVSLEW